MKSLTFVNLLAHPVTLQNNGILAVVKFMEKSEQSKYFKIERLVKGFANHRRIEILFLLEKEPELSVDEISERLKVNFNTISDHIRKLAQSGLVMKRSDGKSIRHALSDKGKAILSFCKVTG